jgi:hypothetical protein
MATKDQYNPTDERLPGVRKASEERPSAAIAITIASSNLKSENLPNALSGPLDVA